MAVTLAEWGQRVLCLDWDLEAPGLQHYFRPWMPREHGGLVDITEGFNRSSPPNWLSHLLTLTLPGGIPIDFLPAGSSTNYTARAQSLDWNRLYANGAFGEYLERMRDEMKDRYDIVLVDSRTGVTDAGGICTVQLPDLLVMVLTATDQSLEGTLDIGERVGRARDALEFDRVALPILPVLSRFDAREERQLGEEWLERIARRLEPLYRPWIPSGIEPRKVLEKTAVPYVSYWSFGEGIPTLEERGSNPQMISWSMETVAALIGNGLGDVVTLIENRDTFVSTARLKRQTHELKHSVFISSSRRDAALARHLARKLMSRGVSAVAGVDAAQGEDWYDELQRAVAGSKHLVVLVTDEVTKSQEQELRQFLVGLVDRTTGGGVVTLRGGSNSIDLPPALQNFPSIAFGESVDDGLEALAELLDLVVPGSEPGGAKLPAAHVDVAKNRKVGADNQIHRADPVLGSAERNVLLECPVCGVRVRTSDLMGHLDREHSGHQAIADLPRSQMAGSYELALWAVEQVLSRPPFPMSNEERRYVDSRLEVLVQLTAGGKFPDAVFDLVRNTTLKRQAAEELVDAIMQKVARER